MAQVVRVKSYALLVKQPYGWRFNSCKSMESSKYILFNWKGKQWPAQVLRRDKLNSKQRNHVEVELLGEGPRVWVDKKKTRAMTVERIERISAGLIKSTSKPKDTLRELKRRKALRLGLELCRESPECSLSEHSRAADILHYQRVTLDGASHMDRTNTKAADADERNEQGLPPDATMDISSDHQPSSPKVIRKCRNALRRRLPPQTPSIGLLQCSQERTSPKCHSPPQRAKQSSSSPGSSVGHYSPIPQACPIYSLTFSQDPPQESKPGATQSSKENEGVVTSSSSAVSELTVTPPQPLPLTEQGGQLVPADSQDHNEEDDLPSFCMPMEERTLTKGVCVWCKVRRVPYWPAMINCLYRKEKKAGVVFIDEFSFPKTSSRKGVKVALRNIKPFDGDEKADLVEKARDRYGAAIDHCLELIRDYKIRIGCGSFSGSLLEYITNDISIPLRKLYLCSLNKNVLKDHISPVDHLSNVSSPCTQGVHSPGLEVHSPGLEAHSPDPEVDSPGLEVQSPDLEVHSTDLGVHSPGLEAHSPDPEVDSPGLEVQSPDLEVHSTDLGVHSTDLEVHSTDLGVQSTDLEVHSTDLRVHSTDLEVHSPGLGVHSTDLELNSHKTAHNCNNEKMVHFIVRERGLEGHLKAVISGSVLSKWLQAHKQCSRQVVKTYIEDDEQLDQVFYYLKDVLEKTATCLSDLEKIHFILDVLLPEAIVHGISVVQGISVKKAEEKYMQWPFVNERERKEFDLMIAKQMKKWHKKD